MGVRKHLYGYIGIKDFTLYPLLRPGSIVTIDDTDKTVRSSGWKNEFDRPIYFLNTDTVTHAGGARLLGTS